MRPSPNKVCMLEAGSWLAAWAESTHCLLRPGKTRLIYAEPWESFSAAAQPEKQPSSSPKSCQCDEVFWIFQL